MSGQIINPPQLCKPIGFAHGVKAGPFVYLGRPNRAECRL